MQPLFDAALHLRERRRTPRPQRRPRFILGAPHLAGQPIGAHQTTTTPSLAAPWRISGGADPPDNNNTRAAPWGNQQKQQMPHSGMTPAELAKFMSRGRRKNPEDEEPIFMRLDSIVDERAILKDRHAAGHAAAQALQATMTSTRRP